MAERWAGFKLGAPVREGCSPNDAAGTTNGVNIRVKKT